MILLCVEFMWRISEMRDTHLVRFVRANADSRKYFCRYK